MAVPIMHSMLEVCTETDLKKYVESTYTDRWVLEYIGPNDAIEQGRLGKYAVTRRKRESDL